MEVKPKGVSWFDTYKEVVDEDLAKILYFQVRCYQGQGFIPLIPGFREL